MSAAKLVCITGSGPCNSSIIKRFYFIILCLFIDEYTFFKASKLITNNLTNISLEPILKSLSFQNVMKPK